MVYYKIPCSSGFTFPRGCILRRAYPSGTYMCCEFESVVSIESNWVAMNESGFTAGYPSVETMPPVYVEEMTALSATLSNGAVTLTLPSAIRTGTTVKFKSPCGCGAVTKGLIINGETYAMVDSLKQPVSSNSLLWEANALIKVIMDVEEKQAFVQDLIHIYQS